MEERSFRKAEVEGSTPSIGFSGSDKHKGYFMAKFNCKHCGELLEIGDELIGDKCVCPSCNNVNIVDVASPSSDVKEVSNAGVSSGLANRPVSAAAAIGGSVPKSTAQMPITFGYSGFWKRFAAHLIDSLVMGITGGIIGGVLGGIIGGVLGAAGADPETISSAGSIVGGIIGLILRWLYYTLMESSVKQATLGKMAMSMVVVDENGERLSLGRANGRFWGKIVSCLILCIDYMMAGFTAKKQALHDIMAKTLVVNIK